MGLRRCYIMHICLHILPCINCRTAGEVANRGNPPFRLESSGRTGGILPSCSCLLTRDNAKQECGDEHAAHADNHGHDTHENAAIHCLLRKLPVKACPGHSLQAHFQELLTNLYMKVLMTCKDTICRGIFVANLEGDER